MASAPKTRTTVAGGNDIAGTPSFWCVPCFLPMLYLVLATDAEYTKAKEFFVMSKLLSSFDDYEKNTGYTADNFFDRYIKPVIVLQKKTLSKKETISYDFKWAVWERDNFTCQHCGSRKNLSVDHIIPESKGGQLTMENVQTLCCKCNSKKGAR